MKKLVSGQPDPSPPDPVPVPQPASKNTCWFLLSPFMFHTNQETTAWRHCGQVTESVSEEEEAEELQRCDWILMSDLHVFAGQMVWMRWQKDQEVEHVLQPVITLVFSPYFLSPSSVRVISPPASLSPSVSVGTANFKTRPHRNNVVENVCFRDFNNIFKNIFKV